MCAAPCMPTFTAACCGGSGIGDGNVETAHVANSVDEASHGEHGPSTTAPSPLEESTVTVKSVITKVQSTMRSSGDQASSKRVLLTDHGRRYIEATFDPTEPPDASIVAGPDKGTWLVYYDTKTLLLIRQDAWLRQRGGVWELQVRAADAIDLLAAEAPLAARPRGAETAYHIITGEDKILVRLASGSATGAKAASFVEELTNFGIRPFARLRTEHLYYEAELPGSSKGQKLFIDLERVQFDTAYAEPAALSSLLSARGSGEGPSDGSVVAAFAGLQVFGSAEPPKGDGAQPQVDAFLQKHGLDAEGGGSRPGSSYIAEYLRSLRPSHLRQLVRAGVRLDPEVDHAELDAAAVPDASPSG